MTARRLACDHAWIDGAVLDRVVIGVVGDRIAEVTADAEDFDEVARVGTHLRGVTLPGLVDAHSHAFHRALRGRTHGGGGSFWTWREQMYAVAGLLDPDSYHALAVGVFGEMLLAGITTVGEFHYLHHPAEGGRYDDPNAMGAALVAAADEVGIRTTLLDALYLTADLGRTRADPGLDPVQQRFSDGDVEAWAARVEALRAGVTGPTCRVGAALHSVRAVPPPDLAAAIAQVADGGGGSGARADVSAQVSDGGGGSGTRADVSAQVSDGGGGSGARADVSAQVSDGGGRPGPMVVHAHVAEQPAEVRAATDHHGRTPVGLLADAGALGPAFTAVHAVWVDDDDTALLGGSGASACICPTTERDLADGIAPADRLADAGVTLALGTDQHAAIDLLEEARAMELDLRLATQRRGSLSPGALLDAATVGGARSLGWADAGRIAPGALADLCVVGLDSVRLAGLRRDDLAAGVVFAATAADITHTMVGGRMVVVDGQHRSVDVASRLRSAIGVLDPTAVDPTAVDPTGARR